MAYDAVKSDEQCHNDTCPSFYSNADLKLTTEKNNPIFQAIILDSIGNLNPNIGEQQVNDDSRTNYPGLVKEIKNGKFSGDFLVANSQKGSEAEAFLGIIADALKQEGKFLVAFDVIE